MDHPENINAVFDEIIINYREYYNNVISYLLKLKLGKIISISSFVKPENRDLFIRCIKARIYGSGDFEFSDDYEKIKKIK